MEQIALYALVHQATAMSLSYTNNYSTNSMWWQQRVHYHTGSYLTVFVTNAAELFETIDGEALSEILQRKHHLPTQRPCQATRWIESRRYMGAYPSIPKGGNREAEFIKQRMLLPTFSHYIGGHCACTASKVQICKKLDFQRPWCCTNL